MTPEERIEYLVGEVNRLNNFITERDQRIEMLLEEKASLMDDEKTLQFKIKARDSMIEDLWKKVGELKDELTMKEMDIVVLKSHLDKLTKEILG